MKRIIVLSVLVLISTAVFAQVKTWPQDSLAMPPGANLQRLLNAKTSYLQAMSDLAAVSDAVAKLQSGKYVPILAPRGAVYVKLPTLPATTPAKPGEVPLDKKFVTQLVADYNALQAALVAKKLEYVKAVLQEGHWVKNLDAPTPDEISRAEYYLAFPNKP